MKGQEEAVRTKKFFYKGKEALLGGILGAVVASSPVLAQNTLPPGSQPLEMRRILGVFPVVKAPSLSEEVAPLSKRQKFEMFEKTTFDPGIVPLAALGASFYAGRNVQPAYGYSAAAFGQRTGAIAADLAINNLVSRTLLPIAFHQDPRFFRKQDGSKAARFLYGIRRTFVARKDDGHETVNTSFLLGYAVVVAASNAYFPDHNRNAADSAKRYGNGLAIDTILSIIREFWKKQP